MKVKLFSGSDLFATWSDKELALALYKIMEIDGSEITETPSRSQAASILRKWSLPKGVDYTPEDLMKLDFKEIYSLLKSAKSEQSKDQEKPEIADKRKKEKAAEMISDTEAILKDLGIKNYKINEDLTVDVKGNVQISRKGLTSIPVQFGIISGDFNCDNNKLTSLEGSPKEVKGSFDCSVNELTSLQGGPKEVGSSFYCGYNNLTTLDGSPKEVKGNFYSYNNKLKSLQGSPKEVGGSFLCSNNKLTSLQGSPEEVKGNFECSDNELTSLEGSSMRVGGDFNCTYNKAKFTEDEVNKVSNVNGKIFV